MKSSACTSTIKSLEDLVAALELAVIGGLNDFILFNIYIYFYL